MMGEYGQLETRGSRASCCSVVLVDIIRGFRSILAGSGRFAWGGVWPYIVLEARNKSNDSSSLQREFVEH